MEIALFAFSLLMVYLITLTITKGSGNHNGK